MKQVWTQGCAIFQDGFDVVNFDYYGVYLCALNVKSIPINCSAFTKLLDTYVMSVSEIIKIINKTKQIYS